MRRLSSFWSGKGEKRQRNPDVGGGRGATAASGRGRGATAASSRGSGATAASGRGRGANAAVGGGRGANAPAGGGRGSNVAAGGGRGATQNAGRGRGTGNVHAWRGRGGRTGMRGGMPGDRAYCYCLEGKGEWKFLT